MNSCERPEPEETWCRRYRPHLKSFIRNRESSSPLITVVVVTHQANALLQECLERLHRQSGLDRENFEIILVNNGRGEHLDARLAELVDLELHLHSNRGACSARNMGCAWATSPILNFVDDDALVFPDYLSQALRWFSDPEVVGLRGRIVAHKHPYFTSMAQHYDRGAEAIPDALLTEGNCFVRRQAFLTVGGFQEDLSPHEGLELSSRLYREYPQGKLMYVPELTVAHDYCDSWKKFFHKRLSYARNEQSHRSSNSDLHAYLEEYQSFVFPSPQRGRLERLARRALLFVSAMIGGLVRLKPRAASPYAHPGADPSFLILGAQKSGTTWLSTMLHQHPEVCMPDKKELHFFSKLSRFKRGLNWYRRQFQPTSQTRAIGEATPNYFWTVQDQDEQEVNGQNMDIPQLVKQSFPELKFVLLLRDPVERAISAYYHHIRAGRISPESRILDVADRFGILSMGFYDVHLTNWLGFFPKESFLILLYEEVFQEEERAATIRAVSSHLGIEPSFEAPLLNQRIHSRSGDFETRLGYHLKRWGLPDALGYGLLPLIPHSIRQLERWRISISEEERDTLRSLYRESVASLEALLERELPWP